MILLYTSLISCSEDLLARSLAAPFTVPEILKAETPKNFLVALFLLFCLLIILYPNKTLDNYKPQFIASLGITIALNHFLPTSITSAFPYFSYIFYLILGIVFFVLASLNRFKSYCIAVADGYFGGFLIICIITVSNTLMGLFIMIAVGISCFLLANIFEYLTFYFSKTVCCSYLLLGFISLIWQVFDKAMLIINVSPFEKYTAKFVIISVIAIFALFDLFVASVKELVLIDDKSAV